MLQIDKKNYIAVGYIQKPHGSRGELTAVITDEFAESFDSPEYIFIDIDGGLVPFFISEDGWRYKNNESVIVKFDFIDSPSSAKNLTGCKLYANIINRPADENIGIFHGLKGMDVIDVNRGDLGRIHRIDDFSGNVVITVNHPNGEILIPLSDQIIKKIDEINKKLILTCPDGLIDIYLK
jgi:16S rRNA processing protein RimM